MDFLFLTGIILTVVPLFLIIGFSFYIFLAFVRDDPDASAITRTAFITMFVGIFLIIWHFVSKML